MVKFRAMQIGKNIKILRYSKKLSQKELAKKVGVTSTYISLIENDSKMPSLSLIEKISRALDIPLALLFNENLFSI